MLARQWVIIFCVAAFNELINAAVMLCGLRWTAVLC